MHHSVVPLARGQPFAPLFWPLIDCRLPLREALEGPWVQLLLSAESNSPKNGQLRAGRGAKEVKIGVETNQPSKGGLGIWGTSSIYYSCAIRSVLSSGLRLPEDQHVSVWPTGDFPVPVAVCEM